MAGKKCTIRRIFLKDFQVIAELKSNGKIVGEQKLRSLSVGESAGRTIGSIHPIIADIRT
jgi:hypothetical protein